jgi:Flp pilus assembly protein TadD
VYRPEFRSALGGFYARRGLTADAEAEYKAALRLEPQFAPAAINLADLYWQLGRNGDASQVLQAAIEVSPRDAGLHYALGLALVRAKRLDEAIAELRQVINATAIASIKSGHQLRSLI